MSRLVPSDALLYWLKEYNEWINVNNIMNGWIVTGLHDCIDFKWNIQLKIAVIWDQFWLT